MGVSSVPVIGLAEEVGAPDSQHNNGRASFRFTAQRLTRLDVILVDADDVGIEARSSGEPASRLIDVPSVVQLHRS